jgi:hypothetical protein
MVLVLFIVSLLTFLIFVKLPAGDPARRAVGKTTTPEQIEAARKAFGLDKPLYVQYGRFAKGLIPWPSLFLDENVYYSYSNFVPVKEEIYRRLPVTITLAVGAAILWIFIGIPIGIVSGIKRGSFYDRAGMLFALASGCACITLLAADQSSPADRRAIRAANRQQAKVAGEGIEVRQRWPRRSRFDPHGEHIWDLPHQLDRIVAVEETTGPRFVTHRARPVRKLVACDRGAFGADQGLRPFRERAGGLGGAADGRRRPL